MESLDEETYTTVDFELDGQVVSAKMTNAMVTFLNDNENLKKQIIEKLIADSNNQGQNTVLVAKDDEETTSQEILDESPFKWTHEATVAFLELYEDVSKRFGNSKTNKVLVWQTICKEMNEKGFRVNEFTCDRKMRSMKTKYQIKHRKILETGKTPSWKYFTQLDKIFGNIICNKQKADEDSDGILSSSESSSCCSEFDNDEYQNNTIENIVSKKRKRTNEDIVGELHEAWGMELFRRTYMEFEYRKLKIMKKLTDEMRNIHRQQEHRNVILKGMLEEIKRMNT